MTEKRFSVDYDITVGNYCLHDSSVSKGVDGYIAYLSSEERANNLCELLNKQEDLINTLRDELELADNETTRLEEENEQLRKELFESKKDYLIETYADNPIRRDDRIKSLKEEFKKRFGDMND